MINPTIMDTANALALQPAKRKSLFHILEEHQAIADMLEENGGELTQELDEALQLTQEHFAEKAQSYGFVLKQLKNEEIILEAEIERLKEMQDRKKKVRETLSNALAAAFDRMQIKKLALPLLTISVTSNESVEVFDKDALPVMFTKEKTEVEPNKIAIKKAIKEGITVPGARLVQSKNLQIK